MKVISWVAGGLLALLLVAAVVVFVALLFVDWNFMKPHVEAAASDVLGRQVKIQTFGVNIGTTSVVEVHGVTVANPDWVEGARPFAAVQEIEFGLKLWPLLRGDVDLPWVFMKKPEVTLVRNADGRANWSFGRTATTAAEIASPESREDVPVIGRLRILDGDVSFDDAETGVALAGTLSTAKGDAKGEDRIELDAEGTLAERPFSIAFEGGSAKLLRETEQPFPIDLEASWADSHISLSGTMQAPLELKSIDLKVEFEGPSLAETFPLLGIPLPRSPPYKLAGMLRRNGQVWRIEDLHGNVGGSDVSGDLLVDRSKDPPFLEADLVSKKIDTKDLSSFLGTDSGDQNQPAGDKAEKGETSGLFPNVPIAFERLDRMNMDVSLKAQQVMTQWMPVDNITARIQLSDRRLLVKPLELAVADGTVKGEIAFNARGDIPSADADLAFEALNLKPFFEDTEFVQEMGGQFSGHIYLLGEGDTLDRILARASGDGWVAMQDGTVSALLVEAIGLDVAEALVVTLDDDSRAKIRCGRVDLDATAGKLNASRAIVDTSDSILLAKGWIDLDDEVVKMQLEARAKDFSLIDMAAPVMVSGRLADPDISIGGLDPLPFFELGQASDLDCARLVAGELGQTNVPPDD